MYSAYGDWAANRALRTSGRFQKLEVGILRKESRLRPAGPRCRRLGAPGSSDRTRIGGGGRGRSANSAWQNPQRLLEPAGRP